MSGKRKIFGSTDRPRLSVFRSAKNIHAQIIDDLSGRTLVAFSSLKMKQGGNIEAAKAVGRQLAEKAKAAGISKVVFDRGKNLYHGRVKALADAVREGGISF